MNIPTTILLPANVWWSLLVVCLLGLVILFVAHRWMKEGRWRREFVRDIGIAFVVAAVVSGAYEFNTRTVEEHETVLATINRAMAAFIPDDVWTEVKEQILRRNAIRYNVELEIRISRTVTLPNGKLEPMPNGKVAVWVSYSYDLQALGASEVSLPIQHELDYFMRDDRLNLPRFERVLIVGSDPNDHRQYRGASLRQIYDGKGSVKLESRHSVRLPSGRTGRRVRIITERQEIVNVPGYYYLVMRELTARDERDPRPTVKVLISEIPDDIEAKVETYYAPHQFTASDRAKRIWTLDGTLLPGQGLTVVLTPRRRL